MGAIVIIGIVAYLAYPKVNEVGVVESAPPPLKPSSTELQRPQIVEPTDYLGPAKTRAISWNQDSQLVSIEAVPVVAGGLTSGSGTIRFTFAGPSSRLGPGELVSTDQLTVTWGTNQKLVATTTTVESTSRSVADPGCTVRQAWRAIVASGVPSSAEATVTYEHSEKYRRAVWHTTAASDPKYNRTLDGRRCTILTR